MRGLGIIVAVVLLATDTSGGVNAAQDTPAAPTGASDMSGLHDFDFLVGEWRSHSRRLKERLAGSNEWEEFEGTIVSRRLMDGFANVDGQPLRLHSANPTVARPRLSSASESGSLIDVTREYETFPNPSGPPPLYTKPTAPGEANQSVEGLLTVQANAMQSLPKVKKVRRPLELKVSQPVSAVLAL